MTCRPLVRELLRAPSRDPFTRRGGHPVLSTVAAIVAYYNGTWYDPSDISTLSQDAAGTTPVAADGDPIGRMKDKGPLLIHATQSTAGARPLYHNTAGKFTAEWDGIDDLLSGAVGAYSNMIGYHYIALAVARTTLTNLSLISVEQTGALYHRMLNSSVNNRLTGRAQDGGSTAANSATNSVPVGTTVVADSQWLTTAVDLAINAGVPVSAAGTTTGATVGPNTAVLGNAANDMKMYGCILLRAVPVAAERLIIQQFLATKI